MRFDAEPAVHNNHDGTFEDIGLLSGVALNEDGQEQGGMGVAVADYDEDGAWTSSKRTSATMCRTCITTAATGRSRIACCSQVWAATWQYVGWGVHLADMDHDGRRDMLMINGHVYPEADKTPEIRYRQPRLFYWHVGGGKFKDLSAQAGSGVSTQAVVPGIRRWRSR